VDLDAIYLHLAKIQLNLEKVKRPSIVIPAAPTENLLAKVVEATKVTRLDVNNHAKSRSISVQKSRPGILDILKEHNRRPSLNVLVEEEERPDSRTFFPPTPTQFNPFHIVKARSGEITEEATSNVLINIPDVTGFRPTYGLSFLASKARMLKDNIDAHSDAFAKKLNKKKTGAYNEEAQRTPLRRVVMYTKQSQENSGAGVGTFPDSLIQALELLADKLQNSSKTMPFKNAVITY